MREVSALLDATAMLRLRDPPQWNDKDVWVCQAEVSRAARIVNPGPVDVPTESPRTKRHSPAQGGTGAKVALLALTSLYAGSAGLTTVELPVVRASTDLLKSGRSAVRPRP